MVSGSYTYIIATGIPDAPESLRAVPGSVSIHLSWKPPSEYHGQITQYHIQYWDSNRQSKTAAVNGNTLELILTGLKPEETYTIQVRASTRAGRGESTSNTTSTLKLCKYVSDTIFKPPSPNNIA